MKCFVFLILEFAFSIYIRRGSLYMKFAMLYSTKAKRDFFEFQNTYSVYLGRSILPTLHQTINS